MDNRRNDIAVGRYSKGLRDQKRCFHSCQVRKVSPSPLVLNSQGHIWLADSLYVFLSLEFALFMVSFHQLRHQSSLSLSLALSITSSRKLCLCLNWLCGLLRSHVLQVQYLRSRNWLKEDQIPSRQLE